jgi:choline dehydrogenase-like flavoprotein
MVRHPDYPTATKDPWDLPYGNRITQETRHASRSVAHRLSHARQRHWFVDDLDNPTSRNNRSTGCAAITSAAARSCGRARVTASVRMDFEANAKEGVGIPWPVTYDEIAPWYDKAEIFAGISGNVDGLPQLPDGKFLPPHDLNCVEVDFKETHRPEDGRKLIIGRCANLTAPLTTMKARSAAPARRANMCIRGCPFGAYFSSVRQHCRPPNAPQHDLLATRSSMNSSTTMTRARPPAF